jgi:hypothetical protein
MADYTITIEIKAEHNFGDMQRELMRIRSEADFSLTVLEGIQAIQHHQRREAPKGHGNIPRSIRPARVIRNGRNSWSGTSMTNYGPAIFTNEGTGTHGPSGRPYPIVQRRTYKSGPRMGQEYEINIMHPGIRGQRWWERGIEKGTPLAFEAFKRKVDTMLKARSGRRNA